MKWRTEKIEKAGKKDIAKFFAAVFLILAALVAAVLILNAYVITFYRVTGTSMLPSYEEKQIVFVQKAGYEIERGDVVAINREGETPLIKRVIAVGGDTLKIDGGNVYLNGGLLDEKTLYGVENGITYARQTALWYDGELGALEIEAGYIFVMGDNREVSNDSRSLGVFPVDEIIGKVI